MHLAANRVRCSPAHLDHHAAPETRAEEDRVPIAHPGVGQRHVAVQTAATRHERGAHGPDLREGHRAGREWCDTMHARRSSRAWTAERNAAVVRTSARAATSPTRSRGSAGTSTAPRPSREKSTCMAPSLMSTEARRDAKTRACFGRPKGSLLGPCWDGLAEAGASEFNLLPASAENDARRQSHVAAQSARKRQTV